MPSRPVYTITCRWASGLESTFRTIRLGVTPRVLANAIKEFNLRAEERGVTMLPTEPTVLTFVLVNDKWKKLSRDAAGRVDIDGYSEALFRVVFEGLVIGYWTRYDRVIEMEV